MSIFTSMYNIGDINLGEYKGSDLYAFLAKRKVYSIIRRFGNEKHDYISGLNYNCEYILEGIKRAVENKLEFLYINREIYNKISIKKELSSAELDNKTKFKYVVFQNLLHFGDKENFFKNYDKFCNSINNIDCSMLESAIEENEELVDCIAWATTLLMGKECLNLNKIMDFLYEKN